MERPKLKELYDRILETVRGMGKKAFATLEGYDFKYSHDSDTQEITGIVFKMHFSYTYSYRLDFFQELKEKMGAEECYISTNKNGLHVNFYVYLK